jgi:ribonuclease BN (tRNA processing enzyme)
MRVTVLGSSASYPEAGRACAGYLLEAAGLRVMLDCGNGSLSNLGRVADPVSLDAVFISHAHVDHFADLFGLQAALRYAPDGPSPALPLHLPHGLFERMECLLSETGRSQLAEAFVVHHLADGGRVSMGAVGITPHLVDHAEESYALVAEIEGLRMCYTADARLDDSLRAIATGADLLIADATLPEGYAGRAPHMTPTEAGMLAHDTHSRTLVLTHLWPSVSREAAFAEASAVFSGRVIVADELDVFEVGS